MFTQGPEGRIKGGLSMARHGAFPWDFAAGVEAIAGAVQAVGLPPHSHADLVAGAKVPDTDARS